jgi:hypothetical protein
MWGLNNSNRLIYDESVLEYLNNHEKVRNTLPKIIANIFDKLGDVKLKLAIENEKELEIYIRFPHYDESTLPKVGAVIEYCANDILEITKSDENLWVHISTDFVGYD